MGTSSSLIVKTCLGTKFTSTALTKQPVSRMKVMNRNYFACLEVRFLYDNYYH